MVEFVLAVSFIWLSHDGGVRTHNVEKSYETRAECMRGLEVEGAYVEGKNLGGMPAQPVIHELCREKTVRAAKKSETMEELLARYAAEERAKVAKKPAR